MKRTFLVVLVLIGGLPFTVLAERGCKTIHFKPGGVYTINAAMYKGTHIQLPMRLLFDPVAGDSDLWTVEANGHHVMVQPNCEEAQGARTNLTLVTEDNTSYHFELHRVAFNQADTCVIIEEEGKFFDRNQESGGDNYLTTEERKQIELQQQVTTLKAALEKEKHLSGEKMDALLSKYRTSIYTRYEWSKGLGFKGSDLVTDVWDDGRFTFVRTKQDHRGMLAASAEVDGNAEMIEYKLDSDYVYRISGIFPKITLTYGKKNKVVVKRRDNATNGVY
ncbi:hypothetical protein JCM12296A_55850 [Desulfosarcina cetonica]|uniref:TrbG/VirB9 family P-type conjugative transfer protein n=1 Tax=Desulfosarcina cetonica TaxID=90730 RepID=UPI0006D14D48|nr:TrbG/VirB9 family P-type conjugative transfer protein [Desulfosarcina cetonica]